MPEGVHPRVGILISGRGSNMAALLSAMRDGRVKADPAVVVSNVPGAPGLEVAAVPGQGQHLEPVEHIQNTPAGN